ncbi:MAG: hypothetical protein GXN91_05240 [Epsilonproteobacteria bacterium]|nr:hypothetical protein [Campylobacterota bacterium]
MKKFISIPIGTIFSSIIFFAACTPTQNTPTTIKKESALIVIKSPKLSYADQGFIFIKPNETKVEIYSNGEALMRLKISSNQICMSSLTCLSKLQFNQEILNKDYPPNLLENVFKGEPIFGGKGLIKKDNGFIQRIKGSTYDIEYKVLNSNIVFRDKISNILIKITPI